VIALISRHYRFRDEKFFAKTTKKVLNFVNYRGVAILRSMQKYSLFVWQEGMTCSSRQFLHRSLLHSSFGIHEREYWREYRAISTSMQVPGKRTETVENQERMLSVPIILDGKILNSLRTGFFVFAKNFFQFRQMTEACHTFSILSYTYQKSPTFFEVHATRALYSLSYMPKEPRKRDL